MTEFSASVPIGGVKVGVEYDLSGLDKGEAELKRRVNRGVRVMVPTPQGAFQAGQGARVAGGGFWNPAWGTGPAGAQMTPGGAGGWVMAPGGGGGGAGGGRARPARAPAPPKPPKPGFFQQPVNFTMGGHGQLLSIYGITRTIEAIADLGSSSIQAARDIKAAISNDMVIKAMARSRQSAESAASQIPLAGNLGIAARGLIDSMYGNSQADIDRENAESERTRDYYQERSDRATDRRVGAARNTAATARLFMGPGGSMAANLALIEEQRKATAKAMSDAADANLKKYQLPDKPTLRGDDKLSRYNYNQDMAQWKSNNPTMMYNGHEVSIQQGKYLQERDAQIAESNRGYSIQKWEQLLGGRSVAQQINPFDSALGAGAVRTDSLQGQDPKVIDALTKIVNNTGSSPPAVIAR